MTAPLRPTSEAEIEAIVAEAVAARTPLAIEGGGTRDIGRPVQAARAVSTLGLSGVTLYEPAEGTELIAAQAADPETRQVWTAFVARRDEALQSAVGRIVSPGNWAGMAGKITAFRGAQEAHVISADSTSFVMTRPFSLANMRLVAANWMSSNIGIYALALLTACIALGIGTFLMLARLGRRS